MSVMYKENAYNTQKNILARPDGYVAYAFKHAKATQGQPGNAVSINGRYIVRAGTIYPANDATAIGVVLNDYDVTDGDKVIAVVVRGDILTAAIPEIPTNNARTALKDIQFLPHAGIIAPTWADIEALEYVVGATDETEQTIAVEFKQGIRFREDATDISNWTIEGESTTKVSVNSIAVSEDGFQAIFTLKTTSTALVAGDITVKPKADAVSIGVVPSAAVKIATVAAEG